MSDVNIRATPEQWNALENLVNDLADKTTQIPLTAQRLILQSIPSLLDQNSSAFVPAYVQLGKVNFHWQLFLENRKGKVFFFFFKRKKVFDNSLIADIKLSIQPYQKIATLETPLHMRLSWLPPPFLDFDSQDDQLKKVENQSINKTNKAKKGGNILWMKVGVNGEDRMAVAFAKPRPQSQIFYFKNDQNTRQAKKAKKAPLEWYETILAAMRPWIAGKTATPIAIDLQKSKGEIQRVLHILSKNFITISQKMVMSQAKPSPSTPLFINHLCPYYQISDYKVDVRFRLTEEGNISQTSPSSEMETAETKTAKKKDELFQLLVQLKGSWQNNQPVVHFSILPPDFLIEGPLFQAFLQELLQPADHKNPKQHVENITRKLGTQPTALSNALTAYQSKAFVFRIQRTRKFDTQMFVLPTIENGQPRTLFFAANFNVDASNNKVTYRKNSIENLLEKPDDTFELKKKGVKYFMQLLYFVNEWRREVG